MFTRLSQNTESSKKEVDWESLICFPGLEGHYENTRRHKRYRYELNWIVYGVRRFLNAVVTMFPVM